MSEAKPAISAMRTSLGRVGIWSGLLGRAPAAAEREAVATVEDLGYGAVWIPEGPGAKDAFAHAGMLLAASKRIVVATGIANVWLREAVTMNAGALALAEAYPGRFLLGIGISHAGLATSIGRVYERPFDVMRQYLDGMAGAPYQGPPPAEPSLRVLAALGPKMMALARDRASGAHPYFVPPEHTVRARQILGAGPLLAPEQAVLLETDPTRARALAREHMTFYITAPNYTNNLRRLGFGDEDLARGGSDRLVDTIVAWGDARVIRDRVRRHLDAGADHVAIQPIVPHLDTALDQLRVLAPVLRGV